MEGIVDLQLVSLETLLTTLKDKVQASEDRSKRSSECATKGNHHTSRREPNNADAVARY